nr:hypothetical protein [Tanacetum cinerariifolium]
MRIEQYFLMTDYSLWEVILNGDSPIPTRVIDGVVQPVAPTTTEQRLARKNELKARGTLLMALPDKNQLKFNIHKDAKTLMEAIEESLPAEWRTHTLIWRNKTYLEDQSFDDLFNRLKIYEAEVKSSSSTSPTIQNIAFVTSQNTDNTNESVSAVASVSAASSKVPIYALPNVDTLSDAIIYFFFASQSNSPQLDNDDLKQIDADDLEEIDLKWQMAILNMRTRGNIETQRRNVPVETSTSNALVSQCDASYSKACTKAYVTLQSYYDKLTNDLRKSQFDVISYKTCLESVEARILVYQQNETVFEEDVKLLKLDVQLRDNALVDLRKKFEKAEQERDELKLKLDKFQTFSKNLSQLLASQTNDKTGLGYDNQVFTSFVFDCDEMFSFESDVSMPVSPVYDRYQSGEEYHVVPPPYTGTFMPSKPDLIFQDAPIVNEIVHTAFNKATSFVQTPEHVKTLRPSVEIVEHHIPAANRKKDIPKPQGHRNSRNRKACFVWNMSYLTDFEEINGGYVAFGKNPKGGKITGKGKIRTSKLDFDDVYFVKELKFNLFSVSQMCDKKNNVLFTDTKCIVLSPNFKLPDENHVLRRVPRENNMYNVDLKNIVPSRDLTCLFAKATLDETPSIGFMRPFGCPVTILYTLDPLGKFDRKADEGFLVGYSVSRSGPTWLFDIDTLTKSMNYQPVNAGSQPNPSADPQNTDDDATFEVKEPEFKVKKPDTPVSTVGQISTNNTNTFSVAGPSDTAVSPTHGKYSYVDPSEYPDDPNMPALEDITYSDDEEDVGAEADFSNLKISITVSPIPTTRVHKDHPVIQIIGDLSSAPQTRSMTRMGKEQGGLSQINNDDFHTCMFVCFLSQEEPKRVWVLVDLPKGKRAIGSKWVFWNKNDERGIVIRNKARLVAQRHTQEEGINYEEVFAPIARIEAVRLFLAYASFIGFMVYQMYVKSAFLYGTIEEEVYVYQPPGFEDLDYPDKVYKVVKALYGLHQALRAWYKTLANYILENGFQRKQIDQTLFIKKQKHDILLVQKQDGIFISQDKYVAEILKKFGLKDEKLASTPIDTEKPLLKNPDGKDMDVHTYRYLKGKPQLGLWYPKDSPFNLVAYSDSDYAGASLDRKSTTGDCQFLGYRLICWQCKKQTVVATSSTKAEYVAAASCCAQVLWIQNQLLDYGYNFMHTTIYIDNSSTICNIKNHVLHFKTKHIEIRHHFIRDCNDNKLIQVVKIPSDNNFVDLLTKAFDVGRF